MYLYRIQIVFQSYHTLNHTMKSICVQTLTSLQENFVISSAYIFYLQASLHIFTLTVLTI